MVALVSGDDAALEAIIRRWERPLFSFAYRYTQNEDATRDIVQETFARVYVKRERYDSAYPLSSWIFTIAANLCRNKARWHRRHPEVSIDSSGEERTGECSILETLAADAPSPTACAEEEEELELLKSAVMALPHDLRTTVLLHHYENLSYKEIAVIVGCSARGVETRLYRARKLLRKRLGTALGGSSEAEKKKERRFRGEAARAGAL